MHNKVQNILNKKKSANQQFSVLGYLADQQVAEFSRKFSVLGCPVKMDFISSIILDFLQNYLGNISLITHYRCSCLSASTVCAFLL